MSSFVANLVRRGAGLASLAMRPPASREAGPIPSGDETAGLSTDNSHISLDGSLESVSVEPAFPAHTADASFPDGTQHTASMPAVHVEADGNKSNLAGDAIVGNDPTVIEAIAPAPVTASPRSGEGRELTSLISPQPVPRKVGVSEPERSFQSIRRLETHSKQTADVFDPAPQPTPVTARVTDAILTLTEPRNRAVLGSKPSDGNAQPAGINAAEPQAHSSHAAPIAEPSLIEVITPPADDELSHNLRRADRSMVLPRTAETSAQSIAVIAAQTAGEHSSPAGIHVRIGQVEVQVNRAQQPRPAVRLTPGKPPGGFQKFFRRRNYLE